MFVGAEIGRISSNAGKRNWADHHFRRAVVRQGQNLLLRRVQVDVPEIDSGWGEADAIPPDNYFTLHRQTSCRSVARSTGGAPLLQDAATSDVDLEYLSTEKVGCPEGGSVGVQVESEKVAGVRGWRVCLDLIP